MKVALTTWEDRISPVFDAARNLLIAEIENGEVRDRRYEALFPEMPAQLGDRLKHLGVEVLICGAISQLPAAVIEAGGIELIPFIGGNVEDVLLSYAKGKRIVPVFSMPGCGRARRRRVRGLWNTEKEVNAMPRGDQTGPDGKGPGTGRGRGGCGGGQGVVQPGQGRGRGKGQGQGQGIGPGRGPGRGSGPGRGNR